MRENAIEFENLCLTYKTVQKKKHLKKNIFLYKNKPILSIYISKRISFSSSKNKNISTRKILENIE